MGVWERRTRSSRSHTRNAPQHTHMQRTATYRLRLCVWVYAMREKNFSCDRSSLSYTFFSLREYLLSHTPTHEVIEDLSREKIFSLMLHLLSTTLMILSQYTFSLSMYIFSLIIHFLSQYTFSLSIYIFSLNIHLLSSTHDFVCGTCMREKMFSLNIHLLSTTLNIHLLSQYTFSLFHTRLRVWNVYEREDLSPSSRSHTCNAPQHTANAIFSLTQRTRVCVCVWEKNVCAPHLCVCVCVREKRPRL